MRIEAYQFALWDTSVGGNFALPVSLRHLKIQQLNWGPFDPSRFPRCNSLTSLTVLARDINWPALRDFVSPNRDLERLELTLGLFVAGPDIATLAPNLLGPKMKFLDLGKLGDGSVLKSFFDADKNPGILGLETLHLRMPGRIKRGDLNCLEALPLLSELRFDGRLPREYHDPFDAKLGRVRREGLQCRSYRTEKDEGVEQIFDHGRESTRWMG